ncbi:hypothetical protein E2562_021436 [Oryza meyeriana var. granulata]|uniref:DUF834 domain-containing protein n=1 Tax=Oryza meyeriana var. granulata TaxID=110450 RepID=A0A6G1EXR0_9ORYZ|nr:hypothetical protein E2562_021436 [Oryza meyeriana var. granulata]
MALVEEGRRRRQTRLEVAAPVDGLKAASLVEGVGGGGGGMEAVVPAFTERSCRGRGGSGQIWTTEEWGGTVLVGRRVEKQPWRRPREELGHAATVGWAWGGHLRHTGSGRTPLH